MVMKDVQRLNILQMKCEIEDLIPNEEVAVTISHAGYIKRTSLSEYKVQNRGGVGIKRFFN